MQSTTVLDAPTTPVDACLRLRCEVVDGMMRAQGALTKAEQARRFGIAVTHWARIRSGETTPTLAIAWRIAKVCGTSVGALWEER